ncbi:LLM class flavin-dependent oxidoreductase [Pseudonocardia spinosispora]|uniref:LLM class flavin-dependent oxidoreductase n=1 Tax=Pseudonocardia spinosispora TaxID=103441 RepID=UPI0004086294|nr:LLM class flavin-dependent oxidoreductase [Pseudonocardia spinosispora]
MKIATEVPWQDRRFSVPVERIRRCEQLGFDAVFTAEGVGNDGLTPLGYLAAVTERMSLGTHISTVTARPPTVLAQALMTIDAMAGGGRVIAGLGSGFPSSCEGWHGRPWGKPVRRMRDYVDVLRQVFRTAGAYDAEGASIETTELFDESTRSRLATTVHCQSPEYSIPYAGRDALGVRPWVSALDRGPADPPVVLAAVGPHMISLTAEIADGWFPWGFAPGMMPTYEPYLAAGFARAGAGKRREDFDIWAIVDVLVSDDVRAGIDMFRRYVVEWAPQMRQQTEALGFAGLCDRLSELVAAGRYEEALASVPEDYVDQSFLIGSHARIAKRLKPWLESGATGLVFRYGPQVQVGAFDLVEDLDVWETIARASHAS